MDKHKSNYRKVIGMFFMAVLLVSTLVACDEIPNENGESPPPQETIVFENGFYRPAAEDIPKDIAEWAENSKTVAVVQETTYEGQRYLLITDGPKPTPGFGVAVEAVVEANHKLEVRVAFSEPDKDMMQPQVITYPYDLVILEQKESELTFVDVNNPDKYFMKLVSLETIDRPIVASSEYIHLFSPAVDEQVQGTITLSGIASVFEGTVNYQLATEEGEMVLEGYAMAAMGDWGYFKEQLELPDDLSNGTYILEVYSESAKDGSKMFVIEIPLTVKR